MFFKLKTEIRCSRNGIPTDPTATLENKIRNKENIFHHFGTFVFFVSCMCNLSTTKDQCQSLLYRRKEPLCYLLASW
jgi:hypothetical protein